jgi:hypothetical protein
VIWYEQGSGQAQVLLSNGSSGFSSSPWIKGYGRPDWAGTGSFSSTNGAGNPGIGNTTAPAISGTPQVGISLTGSPGVWNTAGIAFAYQWFTDSSPISGATSSTYVPTPGDLGRTLRLQVTATKSGYWPVSASSSGLVVRAPDGLPSGTASPSPGSSDPTVSPGVQQLPILVRVTGKGLKLRVDVDPDWASGNYRLRVFKRDSGRWLKVAKTKTRGTPDTRNIRLPKGRYRVTASTHQQTGATSKTIRLPQ